jgi:hypothetical protein
MQRQTGGLPDASPRVNEAAAQEAHDLCSPTRTLFTWMFDQCLSSKRDIRRSDNIPLLHFTPASGMSPNQDFVAVVDAALAKDAKLVVGCKAVDDRRVRASL